MTYLNKLPFSSFSFKIGITAKRKCISVTIKAHETRMRHNDSFIVYALRTKTYYIAVIIQSDPDYAIKTTFNENVWIYDKKSIMAYYIT